MKCVHFLEKFVTLYNGLCIKLRYQQYLINWTLVLTIEAFSIFSVVYFIKLLAADPTFCNTHTEAWIWLSTTSISEYTNTNFSSIEWVQTSILEHRANRASKTEHWMNIQHLILMNDAFSGFTAVRISPTVVEFLGELLYCNLYTK